MPGSNHNVLVVDDAPDVCEVLKIVLEKEGHHVSLAGKADEAVRATQGEKPDIVLLDLCLSDSDTKTFIDIVLSENPAARVVLMSGHDSIVRAAAQFGITEWIKKPFELNELYRICY